MRTTLNADVIVIGAGFAGLQAANDLHTAGKRVLVLEARDRVGGRSMAGMIAGQTIDAGGQWVGPDQRLLLERARELGVETTPQHTDGLSLLSRDGVVSTYRGDIPKLPPLALVEIAWIQRRWRRDMRRVSTDTPWLARHADRWDALSLEAWLRRNARSSGARDFVRTVAAALLCVNAAEVSYLFFLHTLRGGHGVEAMLGVQGGAQQDTFAGGAWQIAERLADRLGDAVRLSTPVHAVTQDAGRVDVDTDDGQFTASRVVIAVPPPLAARIDYSPALPAGKVALLDRMPMGAVIKVHVAYPTPFWRARGLNGSVAATDRALGVVFDRSLGDAGVGVLVGLIEGHQATALSDLSPAARRAAIIADLVHYFGADASEPLDYVEQDWTREHWSRGGYAAHMPPGVLTAYGRALRAPTGRLHWAGTETATEWIGYLDGALQSGIRAANEILTADHT